MLTFFVIVPIVVAIFLYLFPFQKIAQTIALAVQTALFGATAYLFYLTRNSQELITVIGHYGDDLGIILRADSLSTVFILLTAFIFFVVTIYSMGEDNGRLYWLLLFIWESSLIGIFLAGDLFNVFVLTEVATMAVAVLIMYQREKRSMYDGLIYIMVNFVVIQFYLLGLGYLYRIAGFMDMSALTAVMRYMDGEYLFLPYALMMTFIALKCALLPLYSWLPKAHSSPGATPGISAILSGLHIKSGLYLFLRFQDVFYNVAANEFFLVLGIITAIGGILMALSQQNIKRILAYSTIAQVGLIITGLSIGGEYNYMGGLYHMINHGIAKAALFLSAGMISSAYGTKELYKISGVMRRVPVAGFASIMAIFGMIGMPGFNGSISKYFLMYDVGWLLNGILIFINLGTIMVFIRYSQMFFGSAEPERRNLWKEAPLILLGIACFVLGIFGQNFVLLLYGWYGSITFAGYIEKSAIFVVSLFIGFVLVKYCVNDRVVFKRIGEIDFSFRGMCAAMGVFFALVLITIGF